MKQKEGYHRRDGRHSTQWNLTEETGMVKEKEAGLKTRNLKMLAG